MKNRPECDLDYVFQIIGSRWDLLIIWHLSDGPLRFTELKKRLGDVNSKTITSHLRDLEKYQIIHREVYPEVPPRVEYSLTAYGQAFHPIFDALHKLSGVLPRQPKITESNQKS